MDLSEEEYKLAKEAHVANCTGGSIYEVSMVVTSLVGSHMLWTTLVKTKSISADSFIPQFIIYVLPILSCLTLAANYATFVTVGLATLAIAISGSTSSSEDKEEQKSTEYKPYLTVYRAGTMISTCIAILAVDFQFFPRRFAKVETYGTSLMDVGVGSFVFSSGIIASRAYLSQNSTRNITKSMIKAFRSAVPILVLGFARLVLTKGVNYQEHSSEYGLHWNFFFTLGFLPPFVTLLGFCRRVVPFSVLGFLIAAGYQTMLCNGLEDWILSAPRVDLLTANKEGVCSFLGYLSIFLFGLECGVMIFQKDRLFFTKWFSLNKKYELTAHLCAYSSIMWVLFYTWVYFYPQSYVSRRMANLPYVFWVIAFNLSLLSMLVLVEKNNPVKSRDPSMLDAININGLFTFLLANIMTGVINLEIRTLYVNDLISSVINLSYMFVVTIVPFIMSKYQLKIKF